MKLNLEMRLVGAVGVGVLVGTLPFFIIYGVKDNLTNGKNKKLIPEDYWRTVYGCAYFSLFGKPPKEYNQALVKPLQ